MLLGTEGEIARSLLNPWRMTKPSTYWRQPNKAKLGLKYKCTNLYPDQGTCLALKQQIRFLKVFSYIGPIKVKSLDAEMTFYDELRTNMPSVCHGI